MFERLVISCRDATSDIPILSFPSRQAGGIQRGKFQQGLMDPRLRGDDNLRYKFLLEFTEYLIRSGDDNQYIITDLIY